MTLKPPRWTFSATELADAFNENTKAVIINTPNNPTGKVFSRDELETIAGLCIQWDAVAVTDEIYEHILYDDEVHISIASIDGMADRTVTINSLSKTYSVTGWRVGWAMAQADISGRIRKVHDFLTVGAPTPFQKAGAVALRLDAAYYHELQERYRHARDRVCDALLSAGFNVYPPKGAYYIMAGTDPLMKRFGVNRAYDFSLELIDRTGLATVPGTAFFHSKQRGHDYVRFCFAKNENTLQEICKRLQRLTHYSACQNNVPIR